VLVEAMGADLRPGNHAADCAEEGDDDANEHQDREEAQICEKNRSIDGLLPFPGVIVSLNLI
jgi:hypothetical protein